MILFQLLIVRMRSLVFLDEKDDFTAYKKTAVTKAKKRKKHLMLQNHCSGHNILGVGVFHLKYLLFLDHKWMGPARRPQIHFEYSGFCKF